MTDSARLGWASPRRRGSSGCRTQCGRRGCRPRRTCPGWGRSPSPRRRRRRRGNHRAAESPSTHRRCGRRFRPTWSWCRAGTRAGARGQQAARGPGDGDAGPGDGTLGQERAAVDAISHGPPYGRWRPAFAVGPSLRWCLVNSLLTALPCRLRHGRTGCPHRPPGTGTAAARPDVSPTGRPAGPLRPGSRWARPGSGGGREMTGRRGPRRYAPSVDWDLDAYRRSVAGLSPDTVRAYASDVERFAEGRGVGARRGRGRWTGSRCGATWRSSPRAGTPRRPSPARLRRCARTSGGAPGAD